MQRTLEEFAPLFQPDKYSEDDRKNLSPFFTNIDKSVYAFTPLLPPEVAGALCSRASRAAQDLRYIHLHEFIRPFIGPVRTEKDSEESWQEKVRYGNELTLFIQFLQEHSPLDIFANPRARSFYYTWLAQYGDDSIAQVAGMHIGFWGISQVAVKHIEDQRIGLAPIEKSTRYVNYAQKINGHYLYYTDPTLRDIGLYEEYEHAADALFEAYSRLLPKLTEWLLHKFPAEKKAVVEKRAFDTLRGLLPTSTLSQVAFFGNGQAFEYLVNRCGHHPLGEIRWAGERAYEELFQITPSFLRRIKEENKKETIEGYQRYLAEKGKRMIPFVKEFLAESEEDTLPAHAAPPKVNLIEYHPEGETKILTGMLYDAPNNHRSWGETLAAVERMDRKDRARVITEYLKGRTERWQKVGRAFENTYARFEILMNIGAWRDLHRHRMLTQQRQILSCYHGYDIPSEAEEAGLKQEFEEPIKRMEDVFCKITDYDPYLAQYAVTLAHRLRFMQWENLRQSFWQVELRTIPEGHPDYRHIEQGKFRLIEKVYPLIAAYIRANLDEYDFARRGQEEKIQVKLKRLFHKEAPP